MADKLHRPGRTACDYIGPGAGTDAARIVDLLGPEGIRSFVLEVREEPIRSTADRLYARRNQPRHRDGRYEALRV